MAKWDLSKLPEGRKPLPDEWFAERAHMQERIEELEAKLAKAQALAAAVDRRMNDLGGYDNRFDLRKALQEYRGTTLAELKGQDDE